MNTVVVKVLVEHGGIRFTFLEVEEVVEVELELKVSVSIKSDPFNIIFW